MERRSIKDYRTIGLLTEEEKEAVLKLWVLLSYSGPHVGIKCRRQGRLKATNRPSKSAELPNGPRLPPNRGQGDLRLTREGGWPMVLRKDQVQIGNSG